MEKAQPASVTTRVRQELARRGVSLPELVRRMHWQSVSALRNLLSGNNSSARARHRCEQALGVPIWSEPVVFERRRVARAMFHPDDPRTLNRTALQRLARKRLRPAGVTYDRRPSSRLRDTLEEFAQQLYRRHQPTPEEGQ